MGRAPEHFKFDLYAASILLAVFVVVVLEQMTL
jgi:hypothetical protein